MTTNRLLEGVAPLRICADSGKHLSFHFVHPARAAGVSERGDLVAQELDDMKLGQAKRARVGRNESAQRRELRGVTVDVRILGIDALLRSATDVRWKSGERSTEHTRSTRSGKLEGDLSNARNEYDWVPVEGPAFDSEVDVCPVGNGKILSSNP